MSSIMDTTALGGSDEVHSVTLSPDGRSVAWTSGQTINVWDLATGEKMQDVVPLFESANIISFSPDGKTLAVTLHEGLWIWGLVTDQKMGFSTAHPDQIICLAFSPDCSAIASASEHQVCIQDLKTGEIRNVIQQSPEGLCQLAFSPDGRTVAAATKAHVVLWDPLTGSEVRRFRTYYGRCQSLVFSPDSETIAMSDFGGVYAWDIKLEKKTQAVDRRHCVREATSLIFSPDGRTMAAVMRHRVYLWDVTTGRVTLILEEYTLLSGQVQAIAFSLNGRTITLALHKGAVVWNLALGRVQQILRIDGADAESSTHPRGADTPGLFVSVDPGPTRSFWNADDVIAPSTVKPISSDVAIAKKAKSPGKEQEPALHNPSRSKRPAGALSSKGSPGTIASMSSLVRMVRDSFVPGKPYRCELSSQLKACMKEEMDGDSKFGPFLSVTGDEQNAYMTTCEDYLSEKWPSVGASVLEAVSTAMLNGFYVSEDRACTVEISQETSREGSHEKTYVVIMSEDFEEVLSRTQALTWLVASLRPPLPDCLSCSTALASLGTHLSISLAELSVVKGKTVTSCWQPVLKSCVITKNFPTRTGEEGLELPFIVMLDFTGALYRTDLSRITHRADAQYVAPEMNRFFYSGVHSILYPVNQSVDGQIIRWHYEASDRVVVPDTHSLLMVRRAEELEEKTAILGFTPQVQVLLGTAARTTQYSRMEKSSAPRESNVRKFTWDGINFTAGYAGSGITAGFKYRKRRGQMVTVNAEHRDYDEIIRHTKDTAVILFDTARGQETGWLVPQLSVILDLVHQQARKHGWWQQQYHSHLYAALHSNGGLTASDVLNSTRNANLQLYRRVVDRQPFSVHHLVVKIFISMSVRRQQDLLEPPDRRPWSPLKGWDLLELPEAPEVSHRLEVKVHETSSRAIPNPPSWMPLAQETPVYFCDGLGEVMRSAVPVFADLQRDVKTLCASVHLLKRKSQRVPSCIDYHLDIQTPLVWELPRECLCSNVPHSSGTAARWCNHGTQVLKAKHTCRQADSICCLEMDGAAIFGVEQGFLEHVSDELAFRFPRG